MRVRIWMGGIVMLLLLGGCHGPLPAQTFGLEPVTDHGPYRNRLAAYKLRGESGPSATAVPSAATGRRPSTQLPPVDVKARRPRVRRGARVNLRPQDMQPVRDWFSVRNRQFILADVVEIRASKEFFSQVLTTNTHIGMVRKQERVVNGDRIITLKYVGRNAPSAMNSPRVLIGTGFTVTARDTLRVHLTKTYDPARPVNIRVSARGDAARGRAEEVLQKDDHMLEVRGALTWDRANRRWVWRCG